MERSTTIQYHNKLEVNSTEIKNAKIPTIVKFKGDNDSGFELWTLHFEAQLKVLGIKDESNKWRDSLLCCTHGSAFAFVSQAIPPDATIKYDDVKKGMKERFCGDDYNRALQARLRNLRFRKGTKFVPFVHELRTTVRKLYGITMEEAVEGIATSHVLVTLKDHVKKQVQVLQLVGNQRLENLLELVDSLLEGNPLSLNATQVESQIMPSKTSACAAAVTPGPSSYDKCLDQLEYMFEKLTTQMETTPTRLAMLCVTCENCGKKRHGKEYRFKLKKCYS